MPPKRKAAASTGGFKKKAKKTTGSTKYGGGIKKNADKYGAKSIDWDAAVKLAERAAKKEINKNVETQYSRVMATMTHTPDHHATSGFDLGGLNFDQVAKKFKPDQAMIFNLGYLSQQGSSLASGFRIGQRMNCKYLRVVVSGNLPQVSADCQYHWRIVRRKNDQQGQLSYSVPTLTPMTTIGLFKGLLEGPLASQSSYGVGSAIDNPFPFFSSATRQNTEAWTFCKGGHGYTTLRAAPIDTDGNDDKVVKSFCETLYFPIEDEWEFVSRTGSDIKGGNYFFVMWREGGPDYVQYTETSTVLKELGSIELKVLFELAFKDGG